MESVSPFKKISKFISSTISGFIDDDCYTKASVLTYYTMLSTVPILAFLIGIANGFGFAAYLETLITKSFPEQKEVLAYAIQMAHAMIQNISSSIIVGFGVLLLFWTTLNLVGYIEIAFNQIWKIGATRTIFRRFTDYLAIVILLFLVFVTLSSAMIYAKVQIIHLQEYPVFHDFSYYLLWFFKLVPLFFSWLFFFLLYALIPNANIKIWPRLIAAILAGCVLQIWQLIYIYLQAKIFNYNAVYGTFAALPLFLIWLQFSWLIALAGAEIAANLENFPYNIQRDEREVNNKTLGLLILYLCFQTFYNRTEPLNDLDLSKQLNLPIESIRKMLHTLIKGGFLTQITTPEGNSGYHPLSDPHTFSINTVCELIENNSENRFVIADSAPLQKIIDVLNKLYQSTEGSQTNISMKELIEESSQ